MWPFFPLNRIVLFFKGICFRSENEISDRMQAWWVWWIWGGSFFFNTFLTLYRKLWNQTQTQCLSFLSLNNMEKVICCSKILLSVLCPQATWTTAPSWARSFTVMRKVSSTAHTLVWPLLLNKPTHYSDCKTNTLSLMHFNNAFMCVCFPNRHLGVL